MKKFKLTPEIIEKAKAAKSALELITIVKTEGIEISIEEAKVAFAQLSPKAGELRDDEIDNVAGGAGDYKKMSYQGSGPCPKCGSFHIRTDYGGGLTLRDTNEYRCKDCGHTWEGPIV